MLTERVEDRAERPGGRLKRCPRSNRRLLGFVLSDRVPGVCSLWAMSGAEHAASFFLHLFETNFTPLEDALALSDALFFSDSPSSLRAKGPFPAS